MVSCMYGATVRAANAQHYETQRAVVLGYMCVGMKLAGYPEVVIEYIWSVVMTI